MSVSESNIPAVQRLLPAGAWGSVHDLSGAAQKPAVTAEGVGAPGARGRRVGVGARGVHGIATDGHQRLVELAAMPPD